MTADEPVDESPDEAEPLRLDHFLKQRGVADTGGQAKLMIQAGEVKLNGVVETRRRKKLSPGDKVEVHGKKLFVE
ncbi:RNA-binding S4 domain-containing protein [Anatilimnocola floriformis]|uniref:RNA-binding S4 domain-containing protein n=1 Tax=Anatilimnocola floriformis TaxID=2948575 RepID=UPI0036F3D8D3